MRRREFFGLLLGATAWASDGRAEDRIFKVGYLTLETDENIEQFSATLARHGYLEGKNLSVTIRSAEGAPRQLAELAQDLVRARPDVLVAGLGTLAPKALQAATTTIPIVFVAVGDPIGAGLVQTLARPGGNMTGFSGQSTDLKGKQLQLLMACLPRQKVMAVLLNPDTPYSGLALKELKTAAEPYALRLELLPIRQPADLTDQAMDALVAAGATSLFVVEDPLARNLRSSIIAQAARVRLPIMTGLPDYDQAGALVTYGADISDMYVQAAEYVDRILKGASPGDLPVQQPTKFRLVINLRTARTLGIEVPPTLLATADDLVE